MPQDKNKWFPRVCYAIYPAVCQNIFFGNGWKQENWKLFWKIWIEQEGQNLKHGIVDRFCFSKLEKGDPVLTEGKCVRKLNTVLQTVFLDTWKIPIFSWEHRDKWQFLECTGNQYKDNDTQFLIYQYRYNNRWGHSLYCRQSVTSQSEPGQQGWWKLHSQQHLEGCRISHPCFTALPK